MTRFGHVQFDDENKNLSKACREGCITLEAQLEKLPVSRERSIAFTKLEECFMWVNKALREKQIDKQLTESGAPKPTLKQAIIIRKVAQV